MTKFYCNVFTVLILNFICLGNAFGQCDSPFFGTGTPDMTSDITITSDCEQFGDAFSGVLTASGDNRTWTVGNGSAGIIVTLDYPKVTLTGEENSNVTLYGVSLIIENNATLVITDDLEVHNLSSITVKDGGTLIIGGNLLTEGDEDSAEMSVSVTLNIEGSGEIHVGGNAILNYSGGDLLNPVRMYVSGTVTSYDIGGADTGGLEFWRGIISGIRFWANLIGGDVAFWDEIIASIDEAIDNINNNVGGFDNLPTSNNPGSPNPFDSNVEITLPTSASAADFFTNSVTSESIFTSADLAVLDVVDPLSLLNKKIQITSSILDILVDEISHDEHDISSLTGLKSALESMTWTLQGDVLTAMTAYNGGFATDAHKLTLSTYFNQDVKITISIVDEDETPANVRVMAGEHEQEVSVESGTLPGDLPVSLTYFEAFIENNTVALEWETASEQNASHFDIQRSVDRKNWKTLGTVQAAGNSNAAILYEFIDEAPTATAFYRLHQVDFDGANEYFGPLYVKLDGVEENFKVVIMPNHAHKGEKIQLQAIGIQEGGDLSIKIFNAHGHLVYEDKQEQVSSSSLLMPLDISDRLGTGMYYVVVQSGKEIVKEKLLMK
ncbi:T9SS type A sorting domain-containing protein [Flammeovirga pectinis]|uniref:T9SS type A sorting domain-containing protein n=1 Tax=Flammeovirga pectinis TaxID=2494373 RepID=A0A3Q9FNC1_9BACT|nr:T9SS type A sorting domain-containing protein [Flammeovirga pectinis]AZQ63489.1 T9SS type A sorting domain-containing protein [Flammeovirga pectinis]